MFLPYHCPPSSQVNGAANFVLVVVWLCLRRDVVVFTFSNGSGHKFIRFPRYPFVRIMNLDSHTLVYLGQI